MEPELYYGRRIPEGGVRPDDTPPPQPVPPKMTPAELASYAAACRYSKETGGFLWNTHLVDTSRESQDKFLAEYVAVFTKQRTEGAYWKFKDGTFVSLTNDEMSALCLAVREHVKDAFTLEGLTLGKIIQGEITSPEQIDAAFAPTPTTGA